MRTTLALSVCLVFGALHGHAAAQSDDERARSHFEAGRSYYEQARYDDAAREFEAAYQLSGRPQLLLNLSQAHERALRFDYAIASLQRYLELLPDTPDRKTLEERIARLQELHSRVQAAPVAAPAAAPPQPAPAAAPVAAPAPATPPPGQPTQAESERGNSLAVPGFILIGVGGASLLGAVVTGLMAHGDYESLSSCQKDPGCAVSQRKIDSGESMAVVSTVLTGVGIAAAGVGVALLLFSSGDSSEAAATARARLTAGPSELGAGVAFSF